MVELATEAKSEVVVAFVVVAFRAVKFWRVEGVRRWFIKSVVKDGRSTIAVPLILVDLSKLEVGGIDSVAVKCIDIIKNSDCEGSSLGFY